VRKGRLLRTWLDPESFIDYVPGWLSGSDAVFHQVLASRVWGQRTRHLYDRRVREPRLTAPWSPRISIAFRYGLSIGKAASEGY
jgi:hypothetical protein